MTTCACGSQIIWFFDKPTIIACPKCEITFHYWRKINCSHCNTKLVEFTCEQSDLDEALMEEDEETWGCPECDTECNFDDHKYNNEEDILKCPECEHIFSVA